MRQRRRPNPTGCQWAIPQPVHGDTPVGERLAAATRHRSEPQAVTLTAAKLRDIIAATASQTVSRMLRAEQGRQSPGYLTAQHAAEYLDCSRRRIYDLSESGQLRTYKDGNRSLFRRQDLDAVLTSRGERP
jgi:excisionase family DNA binding protein